MGLKADGIKFGEEYINKSEGIKADIGWVD